MKGAMAHLFCEDKGEDDVEVEEKADESEQGEDQTKNQLQQKNSWKFISNSIHTKDLKSFNTGYFQCHRCVFNISGILDFQYFDKKLRRAVALPSSDSLR